jgi:excisionase family DNA binding protein
VSTTTAADLVSRADLLVRGLRNGTEPVSLAEWERFDVTAYRLLYELVGPGRTGDDRITALAHSAHVRVLQSYPTPLRPPAAATTYSTRQAAQYLGLPRKDVLRRIHRSDIPATSDGRSYGIAATDLDQRTDLGPADPKDPRPLPRLSCTFGVLADLLVSDRDRPDSVLHDDTQVAALMGHVLTLTAVAARHTLGHCRVSDADRPLRVAQFAQCAVDALRAVGQPNGLDRILSSAPPQRPNTLNERLEAALRAWAITSRDELNRTVPSTEVLRNIANQGRHIYSMSDHLLRASRQHLATGHNGGPRVSGALREASAMLRHADDQWAFVTTAMRPSHEYVTAARDLFTVLTEISRLDLTQLSSDHTGHSLDIEQALSDLDIAGADLTDLLRDAQHFPDVLIRSHVLFASVRSLVPTPERLTGRARGGYVEVTTEDEHKLAAAAKAAAFAARVASEGLRSEPRAPRRLAPLDLDATVAPRNPEL